MKSKTDTIHSISFPIHLCSGKAQVGGGRTDREVNPPCPEGSAQTTPTATAEAPPHGSGDPEATPRM